MKALKETLNITKYPQKMSTLTEELGLRRYWTI
ncbi:hypothetical protein QFZ77_004327 [Paenibacillus sp. V4I3]|nr:hypothetical protein [Paenibacillus sp. V4I3]MDQ0888262.1 hypothetical protein [Paenibacillus sp. V4I9]